MSKFTELQDAKGDALARQQDRLRQAYSFCTSLAHFLAEYLEVKDKFIFFVEAPGVGNNVLPKPAVTVCCHDDEYLEAVIAFRVDGTLFKTPLIFPLTGSFAVQCADKTFDPGDYGGMCKYIHAMTKGHLDTYTPTPDSQLTSVLFGIFPD